METIIEILGLNVEERQIRLLNYINSVILPRLQMEQEESGSLQEQIVRSTEVVGGIIDEAIRTGDTTELEREINTTPYEVDVDMDALFGLLPHTCSAGHSYTTCPVCIETSRFYRTEVRCWCGECDEEEEDSYDSGYSTEEPEAQGEYDLLNSVILTDCSCSRKLSFFARMQKRDEWTSQEFLTTLYEGKELWEQMVSWHRQTSTVTIPVAGWKVYRGLQKYIKENYAECSALLKDKHRKHASVCDAIHESFTKNSSNNNGQLCQRAECTYFCENFPSQIFSYGFKSVTGSNNMIRVNSFKQLFNIIMYCPLGNVTVLLDGIEMNVEDIHPNLRKATWPMPQAQAGGCKSELRQALKNIFQDEQQALLYFTSQVLAPKEQWDIFFSQMMSLLKNRNDQKFRAIRVLSKIILRGEVGNSRRQKLIVALEKTAPQLQGMWDMLTKMEKCADTGTATLLSIQNLVDSIGKDLGAKTDHFCSDLQRFLFALINNLFIIFMARKTVVTIAAIINIIAAIPNYVTVFIGNSLFETLMLVIKEVSKGYDKFGSCIPEMQAEETHALRSELLITSMVKVILGFCKSQDPNTIKIEDFRVKRLLNVSKIISSSKTIFDFIQTSIVKTLDCVSNYLLGTSDVDTVFSKIDKDIPRWLARTKMFEVREVDGEIIHPIMQLTTQEQRLVLLRLHKEGNDLLKLVSTLESDKKYSRAVTYFNAQVARIQKLVDASNAQLVGMQSKDEPFVVYIHGPAGSGKSLMVDNLCSGLFSCAGETYNYARDKFSKSLTSQYWEGYNCQKVYLIDDFMQATDVESRTTQLSDLISIGSRTPFPLDMAYLENKGVNFFKSDVVIITAQIKFPEAVIAQYIQSYLAFERRIDVFVETVVKEEYKKGGKVLRSTMPVGEFSEDVCNYKLTFRGQQTQICNFQEMVLLLANARERKKKGEVALNEALMAPGKDWKTMYAEKFPHAQALDFFMSVMQAKEGDDLEEELLQAVDTFNSEEEVVQSDETLSKDEMKETVEALKIRLDAAINQINQKHDELQKQLEEIDTAQYSDSLSLPFVPPFKDASTVFVADLTRIGSENLQEQCEMQILLNCYYTGTIEDFVPTTDKGREYLACYYKHFESIQREVDELMELPSLKEKVHNIISKTWFKVLTGVGATILGVLSTVALVYRLSNFGKEELSCDLEENEEAESGIIEQVKSAARRGWNKISPATVESSTIENVSKQRVQRINMKVEAEGLFEFKEEGILYHTHKCSKCGQMYAHAHQNQGLHSDSAYQCCYEKCEWFFKKSIKTANTNNLKCKPYVEESPEVESARDPNLMNLLEVVKANMARVRCPQSGLSLNAFFIKGNVLVFPRHLFVVVDDINECEIHIDSASVRKIALQMKKIKWKEIPEKDIIMAQIPNVSPRRDISHMFMNEKNLQSHYEYGYAVKLTREMTPVFQSLTNLKVEGKLSYCYNRDGEKKIIEIVNHCRYEGDTDVGDCGSLVFASDKNLERKLVGFHVAGVVGRGYCNIMDSANVEKLLDNFEAFEVEYPNAHGARTGTRLFDENDIVEVLGTIDSSLVPFSPTKTSFEMSMLAGEIFPIITAPAAMRKNGPLGIDPMKNGIKSGFVADIYIDPKIVKLAIDHLSVSLNKMTSSYKRDRKLLEDDANINGIVGDNWMQPLCMNTSAGYPWMLHKTQDGKKSHFNGIVGGYTMKDEVRLMVESHEEKLKKGILPVSYFCDTKKDERRTLEKVALGKTRIFSCGPLELTLLIRKYFLNFMAHVMENHVHGECSVGINPHSDAWGMMFKSLRDKGDNWIAGDFTAFDKKLPYQILQGCAEVTNKYYDDEYQLVRLGLMAMMASGFHIAENAVYRAHHGQPSGVPTTAVVNSLANSLMFRIVFLMMARDKFGLEEAENIFLKFSDLVSIRAYGDDHIIRVSKLVPWFNMESLSEYMGRIGMSYTNADKSLVREMYVPEDQLVYLKRKFVERKGIVYAPLQFDVITEVINWVRKSADIQKATLDNVFVALLEMSHYTKKEWNEFYQKVRKTLEEKSLDMEMMTYNQCHRIQRSGDYALHVILASSETSEAVSIAVEGKEKAQSLFRDKQKASGAQNIGLKYMGRVNGQIFARNNVTAKNNQEIQAQAGNAEPGVDVVQEHDNLSQSGITAFSEQAQKESREVKGNGYESGLDVYEMQSIIEFVQRPMLVSSFSWGASDTGVKTSLEFPHTLFKIKSIWDKLKNFKLFRGDIKLTVRVNGTRFHYGKMLMAWVPNMTNGYLRNETGTGPNDTLVSSCSFPNIMLSPTTNEVQELVVPFALPFNFIDIDTYNVASGINDKRKKFNIGVARFWILNPLMGNAAPIPAVHVSVFAEFCNVQLAGYIASREDYVGTDINFNVPPAFEPASVVVIGNGYVAPVAPTVEAQMQAATDPEQEKKSSSRIVSTSLAVASGVAGALSMVPVIGIFGKIASGVLGVGSTVARYFGYTKPNTLETQQSMLLTFPNLAHSRGLDTARRIAVDPGNKLGSMREWMGSNEAENSLMNYMSRYGLLWQSTLTVDSVPGTRLFMIPVTPFNAMYQVVQDPIVRVFHTPSSFVSAAFRMWRGTMKYKVQVVASSFHSVRLRVCWHPGLPKDGTESPLVTEANVVSHILDISTETEYEFSLPYLDENPSLSVCSPAQWMGYISVTLLNNLVHPSSPVPPIFINLWVASGLDMQLGLPSAYATVLDTRQTIPASVEENLMDFEEMPFMQAEETGIARGTGSDIIPGKHVQLNHMLYGEEVVSVKDLIMRPGYSRPTNTSPYSQNMTFQDHYDFTVIQNAKTPPPFMTWFAMGFRYSRGGMGFKIIKHGVCEVSATLRSSTVITGTNTLNPDQNVSDGGYFSPQDAGQVAEFILPFYSNQYFLPNVVSDAGELYANTRSYLSIYATGAASILVYAADDYELGYQVGPPYINYPSIAYLRG